jgi:hypothetical protein
MKRFSLLLVVEAALLLGAANLNAGSIVLSADPSSSSVNVGGTVSVQVEIQGLQADSPNGPSLGGYDFLLGYNPAVLGDPVISFGDPILGDQLALEVPSITCIGTACGASSNFPIEIGEVSLDTVTELNSSQASAFTLATITFTALGTGTSPLDLGGVTLADENGRALTLGGTDDSSVTVAKAITAATPEPRTGILLPFAAGLAGLLLRRRWSSARA